MMLLFKGRMAVRKWWGIVLAACKNKVWLSAHSCPLGHLSVLCTESRPRAHDLHVADRERRLTSAGQMSVRVPFSLLK